MTMCGEIEKSRRGVTRSFFCPFLLVGFPELMFEQKIRGVTSFSIK